MKPNENLSVGTELVGRKFRGEAELPDFCFSWFPLVLYRKCRNDLKIDNDWFLPHPCVFIITITLPYVVRHVYIVFVVDLAL
jgi:hypothetical protein